MQRREIAAVAARVEARVLGIVALEAAHHHREIAGEGPLRARLAVGRPEANEEPSQRRALAEAEDPVKGPSRSKTATMVSRVRAQPL